MKLELKNSTPGQVLNLTLPNGDPFIMAAGVTVDTTEAIGAWLVEHYTEYVTTVSVGKVRTTKTDTAGDSDINAEG